jgi:hypothetical protein
VSYDRQASATVTSTEQTNTKEGKREIYRVSYAFIDESGVERRGESYTQETLPLGVWTVDYQSSDPSKSRLHGMRSKPLSPFPMIAVGAMALFALAIGLRQILRGRRDLRLLCYGVETRGKLIEKRAIPGSKKDKTPTMALTFEYVVDGQTYSTTVETLEPGPLEDDEREPMLYDPNAPSRATMLDHLPGSPRITAGGELEVQSGTAAHLLILPMLFVGLLAMTVIQIL